ncbi:MAG: TonB-dependent receptor [Prevotellaceae bacterium]|jgi:TonB-linked SusC/RagA family outer membrane protein|nr:TonB-dependent receptor [Prevotellaceae bacterium]
MNAQTGVVSGKITDATNQPLVGVSVHVRGTPVSAVSNNDGVYTVSAKQNDVLEFSFIGMKSQQVTVGASNRIDVVMEDDVLWLEETVVIGYGTAKKRDLTGSIASLSGAIVADKPSTNPLAAIQGRVAGVQVTNTGRAGQDPEIRIRGTNSINGYAPLYVVDGLFTDNINYLNPADIESMEILKDASSLAIFGVRGANGVIIISTKRAQEGQTVVNINSSIGWKTITDRLPMTNAAQFKELYNEQRVNQGVGPFDYTNWYGDTNWQDEIFQTGFVNYNNISISGSTAKSKFYAGLGYATEEGNIKTEELSKLTLNLNSEYKVSNYLKFGFQVNGARTLPPDAKGVTGVLKAAPIAPTHYDYTDPVTGETEQLLHTLPDFQRAQASNPLRDIEATGQHNLGANHRLAGNLFGEVNFLQHFTFKATYSLNYAVGETRQFLPIIYEYNPDLAGDDKKMRVGDRESINQSKNTSLTMQQDYILTYNNQFGKHGLTATLGLTTSYREYSSLTGGRSQLWNEVYFSPGDNQDKWWLSALPNTAQTNGSSQWKRFTMSYLARALYNYDNRYLLNVSYRRDGSSVFSGVGNTWDNFYSFGAGWLVSEEAFMQNQDVIDFLKIKGSWGVLGSENTGGNNYPTYPTLVSSGSAVFGDEIIPGFVNEYLVQDLHWEKTAAWEVGFEMQLLKQRLSIEPVYYNKRTTDIIVSLASRTGARNSLENLGEITNKGFELSATWSDKFANGDFTYSIGANLTTIDNKVVSLGRDDADAKYESESRARTLAGYPIAHFYGYEVEGVYQTWEDIKQSPKNTVNSVRPGDLKFKDTDGSGEIDAKDRTMIGNPTPDCIYGFNINLGYKGLDLGIDLMGVYGNEIYRDWGTSTYAQLNYQERQLDRWHGKGTSNFEPILDPSRPNNTLPSSYFIEDGSFFRIRNIQLGYTFSPALLSKIYLKSLRIFANVQNLHTWHKNSGYTPEIGGSALSSGFDTGGYPMPAIYTLGINLSF